MLEKTFLAFREQCIWLQTCFNTYAELYESDDEKSRVMSATAPLFFHDLNLILVEYCLLQVCRLTDPRRTSGRDNLTVEHINALLATDNKLTPEISSATEGLAQYRGLIKDSRNWIISHADKRTLLDGLPIGPHSQADVLAFYENLYRYVNEVGRVVGVGPLDFRYTSGAGDELDLLRYLKAGLIPSIEQTAAQSVAPSHDKRLASGGARKMNRYQRAVLIVAGLTIAAIQIYGISDKGIYNSTGWAISFLISAVLLFIGLGSWQGLANIWNRKTYEKPVRPAETATTPEPRRDPVQHNKPDKYEFGIHISELDIAIDAHKNYAEKTNLYGPLAGNAKSLNWNCCASVYASMRYAARKTEMKVHNSVWNTITRAIVVRMSTNEIEGVGIGDCGYKNLEEAAYADIERINKAVEDTLLGRGSDAIEPLVNVLAIMFGSRGEAVKPLSTMIMMNAEKAQKKILPELLADLF